MKVRHTFPAGQTSASKIKAMLLCLETEKGAKAADAWLAKTRLARTDLENETRLLPLGALRTAIGAFLEELPDALDAMGPYLVAPENLGVWARVLRGTRSPEEAFARIDSPDAEHGRTTTWETLEKGPGHWRGRARITHDPALEKGGLLARARAVELSVVPMLFGFPRGLVTTHGSAENDSDVQEFEVRWALPTNGRGVMVGAGVGVAVGAGALAAHPSASTVITALAAPLLFGGAGLFWSRERAARTESAAQAMRVSALERSLALRETETETGAMAGYLEGSVVAGQYRLRSRMGAGASGVIYEAARITDGTPVAIKLLRAASAHDSEASDRLRREAEALGLAWHPNVVEVLDHGLLPDGTSYLVMELLDGEPLANRLQLKGRLDADELFPIALQLAEALVAVHAAGVVHRDLKPSNIYLSRDAEHASGERVKVLDFGIARVEWEEMRITNIGAPLGTPGYMSPEQESGGEVDVRSDVFAMGALFYECLVGEPPPSSPSDMWKPGRRSMPSVRLPLPDDSEPDTLSKIARAESGVRPASRRLPSAAPAALDEPLSVPGAWRAIVERALAKRPEERFQDARGLLSSLRAIKSDVVPSTALAPASEASSS